MTALAYRTTRVALALVAGLLALGASSFAPPTAPARAAQPISAALHDQLAAMTTGDGGAPVDTGATAVERNALIPISTLPVGRMRGFSAIPMSSPAYGTALTCLTQAIYYEAANEPETGKRAVAQVVLNRLRHPAWPNSVCGVVYEGANARVCQFSFTCDGSLLRAPMARQWGEARRVAAEALAGAVEPSVGAATNYHADYVLPRWAFTLGKLTKIGRHIFYRLPGAVGGSGAFGDAWAGAERIPALDFARLRTVLAAREAGEIGPDEAMPAAALVPGLTVEPDVKDRHASADVGGRLDTTTGWRLSIPDPVQLSSGYRSTLAGQAGADATAPAPAAAAQ